MWFVGHRNYVRGHMDNPRTHRPSRPIILVAFGCWVSLAFMVAVGYLASPETRAPYHLMQLVLAMVGIVGCVGWFLSWQHWRAILVTVGLLFFALFFLRFFGQFVAWQLKYQPLPQAIWQTIYTTGYLISYYFSKGWVLSGIAVLIYEWLLPIAQAIVLAVLLWPLTWRSSGTAQKRA
jgi:hypothetical protein